MLLSSLEEEEASLQELDNEFQICWNEFTRIQECLFPLHRERGCMIIYGKKDDIDSLIRMRRDAHGQRDYMSKLFSIPLTRRVRYGCNRVTKYAGDVLPEGETLHVGNYGEKCRKLLMSRHHKLIKDEHLHCLVGLEGPTPENNRYFTHDLVFPQGGLEEGELPVVGALREALEETGVPLSISHKDPKFESLGQLGKKSPMHVFALCISKLGFDRDDSDPFDVEIDSSSSSSSSEEEDEVSSPSFLSNGSNSSSSSNGEEENYYPTTPKQKRHSSSSSSIASRTSPFSNPFDLLHSESDDEDEDLS